MIDRHPSAEIEEREKGPKIVCSLIPENMRRLFLIELVLRIFSIPSFGDRPNTYEVVAEYFRRHFCQVHRRHDTMRRALFVVRLLRIVESSLFPAYIGYSSTSPR